MELEVKANILESYLPFVASRAGQSTAGFTNITDPQDSELKRTADII